MADTRAPETFGPVLEAGKTGGCVVAATRKLNHNVTVEDRGSYVRVLVPGRCPASKRSF